MGYMKKIPVLLIVYLSLIWLSCSGGDPYLGAAAASKGVKISIRPDTETFDRQGPFPFTIRVHNVSDDEITLRHVRDKNGNYVNLRFFYIVDGAQYELMAPYIGERGLVDCYDVEPGQYIETKVDLLYWGFKPEPGEYRIFAEYDVDVELRSLEREWLGRAMSNKVELEFE